MSQKVLDDFLRDVRLVNTSFTESRSSLRHLIAALRTRIRTNDLTPITFAEALRLTRNTADKRLVRYHPAITTLCGAWGAAEVVVPRRVFAPPPRIVSDAIATLPASPLISSRSDALAAMGQYAVLDALTFKCKNPVVLKREAVCKEDSSRMALAKDANQSAGGKKSYAQQVLRTVHDKVKEAEAGICTTFALAASHILTGGTRQSKRIARVEIVGCARGLATHMYVVVGREGRLDDHTTWGAGCRVVDLWQAAMQDGGAFVYNPKDWPNDHWMLVKLGQFYDSTGADPTVEELEQQVDVVALSRYQEERLAAQESQKKKEQESSEFGPVKCDICGKSVAKPLWAAHQRSHT